VCVLLLSMFALHKYVYFTVPQGGHLPVHTQMYGLIGRNCRHSYLNVMMGNVRLNNDTFLTDGYENIGHKVCVCVFMFIKFQFIRTCTRRYTNRTFYTTGPQLRLVFRTGPHVGDVYGAKGFVLQFSAVNSSDVNDYYYAYTIVDDGHVCSFNVYIMCFILLTEPFPIDWYTNWCRFHLSHSICTRMVAT
jgi:hypothetical protein